MKKRILAELLGTFAIVFFGCGSIATLAGQPSAHVAVNLVFGLVVTSMIYALGPISAAHFNPAVTVAFALARRFPWRNVPGYIAGQILGAILACTALKVIIPELARACSFGATVARIPADRAVLSEGITTFFLMFVIMSVATDRSANSPIPGVAIGGMVMLGGLMEGPLTGNSLNPARSLAPAIFSGGEPLASVWIYILGPVLGAIGAAVAFEALRTLAEDAHSAPADIGRI